jgi:ribonuclease Y
VNKVVRPDDIDDLSVQVMARDSPSRSRRELQYPGQIKITAVRETRSVEDAKLRVQRPP